MPHIQDKILLPTNYGEMEVYTFSQLSEDKEHIALAVGPWKQQGAPLVRLHSECLTGDIFESLRCDCGSQLKLFLKLAAKQGGILVYLRQEGRGIGLYNKLKAYKLQEQGMDTFEANKALGFVEDARSFQAGSEILKTLGLKRVRIATNNPRKIEQVQKSGIDIEKIVSLPVHICPENLRYMQAKQRFGHLLDLSTRGEQNVSA